LRILADYGAARHKTIRPRRAFSPMNEPAETYTIAELAREFDVTHRAIRFYEDEGLLSPGRDGTRRVYSKGDWVRLKLILRGKRLGFSSPRYARCWSLRFGAGRAAAAGEVRRRARRAPRAARAPARGNRRGTGEIRGFERQSRKLLNSRRRKHAARA